MNRNQRVWNPLTARAARGALLALSVVSAGFLASGGCSSSHSQASARDDVTTASCNWAMSCGEIGAGKTYTSWDNCLVQVRAKWDTAWPAASCDGKIDEAQLRLCLDAIPLVKCDDSLGLVLSLAANCGQDKICSGP